MQSRFLRVRALVAMVALIAAVQVLPAVADVTEVDVPSLWVVDDTLQVTANVSLAGDRLTSFPTPNTAISSVTIDPIDGTLWGVNEGGAAGTGKLVNHDRTGQVLREIPIATFGALGAEGMAFEPAATGAFWVVDDPDTVGREPTVYRVARDGTLLSSFTVASFAPGARSPQDIAHDPYDDTLWIVDNSIDAVLHVTTDGMLLATIPTDAPPFVTGSLPGGIANPQGITVDSPTTLWLSSRGTGLIHRIDKAGTTVLATLPSDVVADGATNPVALAFDTRATVASTRVAFGAVAGALEGLADSLDHDDADRVASAVEELTEARDDNRVWTAAGEPTAAEGKRALEAMRDALGDLEDVDDDAAVASSESALLRLARDTSVAAIRLAEDLAAAPYHLEKAREELAEGDEDAAAGDLKDAAERYKKAWEEAYKAIEDETGVLPAGASLWVVDDVLRVTGNLTVTGLVTTSFPTPNTATSAVAVDPTDGTLWGVNEGGRNGAGKLVNIDTTGQVVREIQAPAFGGFGVEGIDVTPGGTLWVVDDPDVAGREPTVRNVARDGTLLSSFTTASFAAGTRSPQAIAYDPYDDTLWITDNNVDRVFNVTTDGTLVRSFATDEGPFVTADAPAGISNPQGITVESATHLWLTSRDGGSIHRVAKSGRVVLQTIPASALSAGATAPVGVAFSATTPAPTVGDTAGTRATLAALRDQLNAAEPVLDGDDAKRVREAVDELDDALEDDDVWTSDGAPTLEDGKDALDAVKKALEKLVDIETGAPSLIEVRTALLDLSRDTAQTQLVLARILAADSDHVGHAEEDLAKGDAAAVDGELDDAADDYKKAWEEAAKALEEAGYDD